MKIKKPRRINLKNFNPNDRSKRLNSPRSLEAILKLGILEEHLYS
jgi:hypothetical protein